MIDVLIQHPDAEPLPQAEVWKQNGLVNCLVCGCDLQDRPTAWLLFDLGERGTCPMGFCREEHDRTEIEESIEQFKTELAASLGVNA